MCANSFVGNYNLTKKFRKNAQMHVTENEGVALYFEHVRALNSSTEDDFCTRQKRSLIGTKTALDKKDFLITILLARRILCSTLKCIISNIRPCVLAIVLESFNTTLRFNNKSCSYNH